MTIQSIDIAEPFFSLNLLQGENAFEVEGRAIVLNLSDENIEIEEQSLKSLESVIVQNARISNLKHAAIVTGFESFEYEEVVLRDIRDAWPSAYDVRKEERLRGIGHYMSPKKWIGQHGFTFYHAATVPLNVGLHKFHDFCPVPGFKEVHTQIVGYGKMQQCKEKDIATLYLEEPMAPGQTHRPMYDSEGNYPWHQFETTTPSVFMAVEILPDGATPPS